MTLNYFAGENTFSNKNDSTLPECESLTGIFISSVMKSGNSPSGYWRIFKLKANEDVVNIFFNWDKIKMVDQDWLDSLSGKSVTVRCNNGTPSINANSLETECDIRTKLLKGVVAGTVKMEDLPALLEFAKGNDSLFAEWMLFKQKIKNKGLETIKGEIAEETKSVQYSLDEARSNLEKVKNLNRDIKEEKVVLLKESYSDLLLLQGEEVLEGTTGSCAMPLSENLIPIADGYNTLMEAMTKLKTRKGIFVICNNSLHKIHYAYLENKGRAYLIGSTRESKIKKDENIMQLIDRFFDLSHSR